MDDLSAVSRTIVQCWERGDKRPRVERFVRLAQVLDVSQETLAAALGIKPPPPPAPQTCPVCDAEMAPGERRGRAAWCAPAARAGALNDYYRSILSLAPTLINMAQSGAGQGYSDGPFGVPKGHITNPEILNAPYMPGHDAFKSVREKPSSSPLQWVGPAPGSTQGGYPPAVSSTSFPGDFLYDNSVLDYLGAGY